jgi:hypothetical protein
LLDEEILCPSHQKKPVPRQRLTLRVLIHKLN